MLRTAKFPQMQDYRIEHQMQLVLRTGRPQLRWQECRIAPPMMQQVCRTSLLLLMRPVLQKGLQTLLEFRTG